MTKKQILYLLSALCMMLLLTPATANAQNDPSDAQRNDDGAIHGSEFVSYGGYYYTVYPAQDALTRHRPDGSENIVLYSERGYTDLTKGKSLYGFDQKCADNELDSFLIYNDTIYFAVILNANKKGETVYPAIYRMNLDGTGVQPVMYMNGGGKTMEDWCIWNNLLYGFSGNKVFTANPDGTGLTSIDFYSESKKLGGKALGYTVKNSDGTQKEHWSNVGITPKYFYAGDIYANSTLQIDEKNILYRMDTATGQFESYMTLDSKSYVSFVTGGKIFATDRIGNNRQWWCANADGSGQVEWLGKDVYGLTAYKGNLYYFTQPSNSSLTATYMSAGLSKPQNPQEIAPTGFFSPAYQLTPCGDMIMGDNQNANGRLILSLDGLKRGFDLAYMDVHTYSGSSVGNPYGGYVIRPAYVPIEMESIDLNVFGGNVLNRKIILSDWTQELLKDKRSSQVMGYDFTKPITRLQFCNAMMETYMKMNPGVALKHWLTFTRDYPNFTDTCDREVQYCYALGIIDGVDASRFNPTGTITNREMETLLARVAKTPNVSMNGLDTGALLANSDGTKPNPNEPCTIERTLVALDRLLAK